MDSAVYPSSAVERAMKVQEVILRAIDGRLKWYQAAEILGISDRQMRRWKRRYERVGYDGLFDRRRQQPSPKRIKLAIGPSTALAEEDGLQFLEGVRPGHTLAERPKGLAFAPIRLQRLRADQCDRDDYDTEAEEQLSLEGHRALIALPPTQRQGKVGSR